MFYSIRNSQFVVLHKKFQKSLIVDRNDVLSKKKKMIENEVTTEVESINLMKEETMKRNFIVESRKKFNVDDDHVILRNNAEIEIELEIRNIFVKNNFLKIEAKFKRLERAINF